MQGSQGSLGHSLGNGVGVQVHAADVGRGFIEVEVARVDAHDEGAGGAEDVRQGERAQRDVRARPVEREDHLRGTGGVGWGFRCLLWSLWKRYMALAG